VAIVWTELIGWRRRRWERRGLLTILDLETEQNERQLQAYEGRIGYSTVAPADSLSVGGWEGTRARLSHSLKPDEYADLAKYYEGIRVINGFRLHKDTPKDTRHHMIKTELPQLKKQSDLARERIRQYVPPDALDGTPLRNLTFARDPEQQRAGRETPAEDAGGSESHPATEGAQEGTETRSWWRRFFGFE
jgi:hypothetical protein